MHGPWLNTNLAKTPTLFIVEFQEWLEIFWETYRFNSPKFFTFTCLHTLRLPKRGFLYEIGFLPCFTFCTFHCIEWSTVVLVFFQNRLTGNNDMADFGHRQPRLVTYATRISLLRSHNKFIASNEERKTPDWFRLTAIFLDSWFSVYLTIIRRRRS